MDELRNEAETLRSLDHPNMAKSYEACEYRGIQLVMEHCNGGNLCSRE